MSIEVLPIGTRCSLACVHCYQDNIRDAGNQSSGEYDLNAMKKALEREGYAWDVCLAKAASYWAADVWGNLN